MSKANVLQTLLQLKFKIVNPVNCLPIARILKSFANDITQKELVTSIPPSSAVSYEKIALYIETQSATREKAAFLIYDWIVQNIGYDDEYSKKKSKKPATADTAFKNKKTSCAGYADLFNKMVTKIGIKCHTLVGKTRQLSTFLLYLMQKKILKRIHFMPGMQFKSIMSGIL